LFWGLSQLCIVLNNEPILVSEENIKS
jgi:hypothetical protein